MKRLYILRHAKSSWAEPGLTDMDRPLNKRGARQTDALAEWFAQQTDKPEIALCSPSIRTRETWQDIKRAFPSTTTDIVDDLYNGTMGNYMDTLSARNESSVMIVGHNPTCDELARYLTAPSSPAAESLMSAHFGTANLAILDLEIDEWNAISEASGVLVTMLRPRDLIPAG